MAVYLPILISFATPANIPYLLLVFGLLYGAPYAVNATYMSESFPTSIRGTAVAASYNVGRIGSTISPFSTVMLSEPVPATYRMTCEPLTSYVPSILVLLRAATPL